MNIPGKKQNKQNKTKQDKKKHIQEPHSLEVTFLWLLSTSLCLSFGDTTGLCLRIWKTDSETVAKLCVGGQEGFLEHCYDFTSKTNNNSKKKEGIPKLKAGKNLSVPTTDFRLD